ncbi:hypothetical protein SADUNF_Sadunf14G0035700 [Salix dunnii]|uniref:Chaperone DnaJ C-terminal domain-containing protein n=1 Tax=Salix dunnii TaxID=1413687 RepID=A0A835JCN8_9ROSI|nr:hypothetical protein SADUNF_Sadunf14G0035700 [Salix dunnii]
MLDEVSLIGETERLLDAFFTDVVLAPDTITGDVVVLQLNEHSKFEPKLDDLLVKCTISLTEALCGYQFALPRLDGRQLLTRSNPGQCKAINDEGMPRVILGPS